MANPYLPLWEYIPDGEPRVFGDRVYVYGSHDRAGSDSFCDYVLKCWSAPIDDLNNWICHGDIFIPWQTGITRQILPGREKISSSMRRMSYREKTENTICLLIS